MDNLSVLLLRISDNLSPKEVEDLKFLCQDRIGRKKMEQIQIGIHLFRQLKELVLISDHDLRFLIELLNTIKRYDLAQEVENFQGPAAPEEMVGRDPLEQSFDIICDNVGRDWKRLIRTLGVPEITIDHAIDRNPLNMREQLMYSLMEWRKIKKDGATVSALQQALDNCRMRLVSEKLTAAINLSHGTS